jgi:hypothetical protein
MGRERDYPGECTPVIMDNAARTVSAVNNLIAALEAGNVQVEIHPQTRTAIASGWRPAALNARVPNAAPRSKHMSAEACDLYDPDGIIDEYLTDHPELLVDLRLYQEHPSATKGWAPSRRSRRDQESECSTHDGNAR